ncbi:2-amino-3-ketobutyrate coenzyme A ligase, mitochondrial isoform X1 [Zalophus californianus]|uniref:2-amino-3-ketobutyrate coenzyme A ligase, mitochondrial isoform X1 n=1 Tax=Zalophus californianus TaxID=9704 RepID=A0A6J2D449_ZALCA|nr:2-amino-3-ketobutyrate coenzyme A ligase, mitochondrial isoform X1 [Zalophus californianus]XP_027971370.1 2-amino-3-ketobutyrate coenzyme A ligase, mitochondrial isoform X1 [Eumetopias jubatus]
MWAGRVLHAALSAVPRGRRAQSALTQLRGVLEEELEAIREAGTWKSERVITSRQGPRIHVDGVSGGILNFCANNYLGLSSHPEVIQAGLQALEEFGAGLSSTRFICGTQALLTPQDAVLSDELNHASIIDGIRLCKAHKYCYCHLDMADLEAKLQEAQKHRLRLVATDGAFSMDGDIAPLREICHLASRYGALVFVDECHATGFLGATGRGTDELLGVMDQVTVINSTLGKALGGASGGYTTGPGPLVSLLRQRSRPYLFSNSLPPAVVGCASKALDLLMESNAIVQTMAAKTQRFRSKMEAAGFTILGASHPICPVMLGDARLASCMADDMLKRGIFVIGFSYPVVPRGKARIRVQISAVHSEEDIDRCVEAFVEVGRLHGALP